MADRQRYIDRELTRAKPVARDRLLAGVGGVLAVSLVEGVIIAEAVERAFEVAARLETEAALKSSSDRLSAMALEATAEASSPRHRLGEIEGRLRRIGMSATRHAAIHLVPSFVGVHNLVQFPFDAAMGSPLRASLLRLLASLRCGIGVTAGLATL